MRAAFYPAAMLLAVLVLGLALVGCTPPADAADCVPVSSVDGSVAELPYSGPTFGVDCDTGGTVTVWIEAHGPLSAVVLEPVTYPVDPSSPGVFRSDFDLAGSLSDNPGCRWERSLVADDIYLDCDEIPSEPFLTAVTIDLGDSPGVVGFTSNGAAASTLRGVS